jgi:hypothetical protein
MLGIDNHCRLGWDIAVQQSQFRIRFAEIPLKKSAEGALDLVADFE